ncbi:hypothetical protein T05_9167 [Trichinella murrelli]|uniref:Uncharacterized protein n=1 Tax=Trichinella murrelli TaxID=144512 RepID=A0A0V0UI86_9BILA|nr:hypothetical protein T05_9167 [Trichinella murrelli]
MMSIITMTKARKQNNSVFYKKRGMIGDSLFRCLQLALRNCKTNKVLFQSNYRLLFVSKTFISSPDAKYI